jgi:glycosyltransferase involved in cell wall biosynthesis
VPPDGLTGVARIPQPRTDCDNTGDPSRRPLLADQSVAVVHEWFSATGGSENVFLYLAELLPHAERFVLWKEHDVPADGLRLRESWLANTPLRRSKALALPVMPLAWRTLSRQRFDIVVSSSHAFAHLIRFGRQPDTRYLSYVHSPARYLWSPAFDGRGSNPLLAGPRRALQAVDVRMSRHVHSYAANSREVQARIRRFWHRDAVVINPPVDVDFYSSAPASQQQQSRDYLLGVGRFVGYKNFDLIIGVAEAAGLPLVIAGSGPDEAKLRRAAANAGRSVSFEIRPSRERLRELYWGARALLFPVHEDFGMIPVEAQACGTPVVGLRRGGLLETVVEGETGLLVDAVDPRDYVPLIDKVDGLIGTTTVHTGRFSPQAFATRASAWIEEASTP